MLLVVRPAQRERVLAMEKERRVHREPSKRGVYPESVVTVGADLRPVQGDGVPRGVLHAEGELARGDGLHLEPVMQLDVRPARRAGALSRPRLHHGPAPRRDADRRPKRGIHPQDLLGSPPGSAIHAEAGAIQDQHVPFRPRGWSIDRPPTECGDGRPGAGGGPASASPGFRGKRNSLVPVGGEGGGDLPGPVFRAQGVRLEDLPRGRVQLQGLAVTGAAARGR